MFLGCHLTKQWRRTRPRIVRKCCDPGELSHRFPVFPLAHVLTNRPLSFRAEEIDAEIMKSVTPPQANMHTRRRRSRTPERDVEPNIEVRSTPNLVFFPVPACLPGSTRFVSHPLLPCPLFLSCAFDCRTGDNIGVAADSTDALPVAIPVVISGNVPVNTAEAAHVEHDNTVPTNSFD